MHHQSIRVGNGYNSGGCGGGCCCAQYVVASVILVSLAALFLYAQFATLYAAKKISDNESYDNAISPMNERVVNVSAILLIICTIVVGLRMVVSLFGIMSSSNQPVSIPPFNLYIAGSGASKVLTFVCIIALVGLCGYVAYTQFQTLDWLKNIRDANRGNAVGETTVIGYLDKAFRNEHVYRSDETTADTQNKIVQSGAYILITYFVVAVLCLVVFQYFGSNGTSMLHAQDITVSGGIPIVDTVAQKSASYIPSAATSAYDSVTDSAKKFMSNLPSLSLSEDSSKSKK